MKFSSTHKSASKRAHVSKPGLWSSVAAIFLSVMFFAHGTMTFDHVHLDQEEELSCLAHANSAAADVAVAEHDFNFSINPVSNPESYETLLLANPRNHFQSRAPPIS